MKLRTQFCFLAAALALPPCHANPIFSWEVDLQGWTAAEGAAVGTSATGATDGTQALSVTTPMASMWWSTPASVNLDGPTRQALFTGATEIKLDVTYPNPGYNSWYGNATVELILQGDGVNWTQLGSRDVAVDGGPTTCTWPITVSQAQALASGTWAQLVLKFTYGNGGSTGPDAVFHVDNLRSTVVIVEPPAADFFWKGSASANWTDLNWTTDAEGTVAAGALPADGSATVAFSAAESDNFSTVLAADQHVRAIVFTTGSGLSDIGGTHDLTLGADGILAEAGSGPVLVNTTGQVLLAADQLWSNQSGTFLTVDSVIAGTGRLTTGGSGSILLNGANLHTGGTAVQQGKLVLGHVQALGPASTLVEVTGGSIDLNGFSPTIAGLAGSLGGEVTNTAPETATLTLASEADSSFNGALNNSPFGEPLALAKSGGGTLTLGGVGNFTGNVTVQQGTVVATSFAAGNPTATNFGHAQTAGRTITVAEGALVRFTSNNIFGNQEGDAALLPTLALLGGTLDATRYNLIGPVLLEGGVLTQSATDAGTYQGYQFKGGITVGGSLPSVIQSPLGKANHLSTDTLFTVADVSGDESDDLIITNPLADQSGDFASAPGGLTKAGPGTLALQAVNTYTGTTRVNAGTLRLTTASLADSAAVEIASGGVLDLAHFESDAIASLVLGGVTQEAGIYGAMESGAEHETPRIAGPGFLVVGADPYLGWISLYPSLAGADAEKTADPDRDGRSNLEEFALAGDPTSGAADGKVRSRVETVGAEQALVITLPVRDGAVFTGGSPAEATVATDGLRYQIAGSNDLSLFDQTVSEVLPALSAGLPVLGQGWSYRSFRLDGAVGGASPRGPRGFLKAEVSAAP
jgi:autotransporter-associated beta strand protein